MCDCAARLVHVVSCRRGDVQRRRASEQSQIHCTNAYLDSLRAGHAGLLLRLANNNHGAAVLVGGVDGGHCWEVGGGGGPSFSRREARGV